MTPRPRILCVDDDPEVCVLLAAWLPDLRVDSALCAGDGLRRACDANFDLYVLDTWLPDGDGPELCRRIREFDPNAPIVFFSAVAYDADRQRALDAGATAYLTKPLEFDQVCLKIPELIGGSRQRAFHALQVELRAVYEELELRVQEARERHDAATARYGAAENYRDAVKKVSREKLKVIACRGYMEGGGTRAQFERIWPGALLTPRSVARLVDQHDRTALA